MEKKNSSETITCLWNKNFSRHESDLVVWFLCKFIQWLQNFYFLFHSNLFIWSYKTKIWYGNILSVSLWIRHSQIERIRFIRSKHNDIAQMSLRQRVILERYRTGWVFLKFHLLLHALNFQQDCILILQTKTHTHSKVLCLKRRFSNCTDDTYIHNVLHINCCNRWRRIQWNEHFLHTVTSKCNLYIILHVCIFNIHVFVHCVHVVLFG